MRSGHWLGMLLFVWLAAVAVGFALLMRTKAEPGDDTAAPTRWPADSQLDPPVGGWLLVVFAHPHCPCTRATLAELERVMAWCDGRLRALVVFRRIAGSAPETDITRRAASVAAVSWDDGMEALRFGAQTSGHAVLYNETGGLRFSGGLTPSRGHEGTSSGCDAIVALVSAKAKPQAAEHRAPTFGCPLKSPHADRLRQEP